jgi:hypothetical protein
MTSGADAGFAKAGESNKCLVAIAFGVQLKRAEIVENRANTRIILNRVDAGASVCARARRAFIKLENIAGYTFVFWHARAWGARCLPTTRESGASQCLFVGHSARTLLLWETSATVGTSGW